MWEQDISEDVLRGRLEDRYGEIIAQWIFGEIKKAAAANENSVISEKVRRHGLYGCKSLIRVE